MKLKEFLEQLKDLDPETELYFRENEDQVYLPANLIYEMWIKSKDSICGIGKLINSTYHQYGDFDTKINVIG